MDLICSVKYHAVMTSLKCKGILFMVSNKAPCDVGVNDLISIISRATMHFSFDSSYLLMCTLKHHCEYFTRRLMIPSNK